MEENYNLPEKKTLYSRSTLMLAWAVITIFVSYAASAMLLEPQISKVEFAFNIANQYDAKISQLNSKIDQLEKNLSDQEARIDKLLSDFKMVNGTIVDAFTNIGNQLPNEAALFDCTSEGFTQFNALSPKLTLLLICDKAEEYLEGYKVHVQINNPYGIGLSGLSGHLAYGKDYEHINQNPANKVDFSWSETLPAASWHSYTVTIPHAKAEDVRMLKLQLQVASINAISR